VIEVGGVMQTHRPKLGSLLCRAGLMLAPWLSAACLVTDEIDYDRPNTPAQVIKQEPLGFRTVPDESECLQDAMDGMNFAFTVRDVDVDDRLVLRAIVNGVAVYTDEIAISGRPQREITGHCIPKSKLDKAGCMRVEILVSRKFSNYLGSSEPYKTSEPYDLGYAEWWVLGETVNWPDVGIGQCEKDVPRGGRP
jgi:hypothetical protein